MIRPPTEILVALERECLVVDKAIAARRWDDCESSWSKQRKLQHELDIALREQTRTPEEEAATRKRMDRLARYREGQIKRLTAFNEAVATRLTTMGRYRTFRKGYDKERRSSLLDVTS